MRCPHAGESARAGIRFEEVLPGRAVRAALHELPGASASSQAPTVIMRLPTVAPNMPIKPFIDILSPTTRWLCWRTRFASSSERTSSTVMENAPGAWGRPVTAQLATPKRNGPIAFGCTTTCKPS
jgi:hypothetical protein